MAKRVTAKGKPWHYTECGLTNVYLVGIDLVSDPDSGEEGPLIPQLEDLHDCIFINLLKKRTRLTGREVRFLRRHLGWTQTDAADRLGYNSPQYFSDVEGKKDSTAFPKDAHADLIWRLLCTEEFIKTHKGRRLREATQVASVLSTSVQQFLSELRDRRASKGTVEIRRVRSQGRETWQSEPLPQVA